MNSAVILAEARFESRLGGEVKLIQYSDGTCAIVVTDNAVETVNTVMLTNPLARCIAAVLAEMGGD